MSDNAELPIHLIEQMKLGQMVLFLGAGATFGATHPDGLRPPLGQQLATMLAEKFLGTSYGQRPLAEVAELAISESDLFTVQDYIASIFSDFGPAAFHKTLASFKWAALATTNYDLVIERAYQENRAKVQTLVPFLRNTDRVDEKLRDKGAVAYLKLHGCVTCTRDTGLPLILTPDQYVNHRDGRSLLFDRLKQFAFNYSFIFAGYKVADPDLRQLLISLTELAEARQRSYLVSPGQTDVDMRFWQQRKITCLNMTLEAFVYQLQSKFPAEIRPLAALREESGHPIRKKLAVSSDVQLSSSLDTFLHSEADYVHSGLAYSSPDPKSFYRGYFSDWAPIVHNLDVRRRITDNILSESIASDDADLKSPQFFLIKGHAGSGKTVILHRVAWEAATLLEQICIFLKTPAPPNFILISELYSLVRQRIFLFVDQINEHPGELAQLLSRAERERIPLTILGTVRLSEWYDCSEILDPFLTQDFELKHLNQSEIVELIALLERHKSLGHLETLVPAQRIESLNFHSGRQLLVALHEATLGKPFKDIVYDEFVGISDEGAKSLYLTVALLHRLGVSSRAGLISRVHKIPFNVFKDRLFMPLEGIVFAKHHDSIQDYVYETRHQHIAEILFERALPRAQDRYDEYSRILAELDIGYGADLDALRGLMKAKGLRNLFPDPTMARQLFEQARQCFPREGFIYQQEAIFEMNSEDGDFEQANKLLSLAESLSPWNRSVAHSRSELALRRAEKATSSVQKVQWLRQSRKMAAKILQDGGTTSHPYHTLIKINLYELQQLLSDDADTAAISRATKSTEEIISEAHQRYPNDSYILASEAKLSELLRDFPKALLALEKAFNQNKRSPYIALRLSKNYKHRGDIEKAVYVLRVCVDHNPVDVDINYELGFLLKKHRLADWPEVRRHLRNSFTAGDARYEAQFQYAIASYLAGEFAEANAIFQSLRGAKLGSAEKRRVRETVEEKGSPVKFSGSLHVKYATAGSIRRDRTADLITIHNGLMPEELWKELRQHDRLSFRLAFSFFGPIATDISREAQRV